MKLVKCRNIWRLINIKPLLSQMSARDYSIQKNKISCFQIVLQSQRKFATNRVADEKFPILEHALSKVISDFTYLGYVNHNNFKKLLEALQTGGSLTPEESVFLLESCGPELMPSQSSANRMELFWKLWEQLKKNKTLQKDHYKSLLKVHAENGVEIENVHMFLQENKLTKYPEMYERLVEYACEFGNVKLATEILFEMKNKGIALSEVVFNALILGHAKNKDLESACVVLETMKAARVKPSSLTYTQLIGAYIRHNNMSMASSLFLKHSDMFSLNEILKIMKTLTAVEQKKLNREFVNLIFKELPAEFFFAKEVPSAIRNLCTELIHCGRVDTACDIMDCLPCPKFNENKDIDTYGYIFLQDLCRNKVKPEKVIEIAKNLIRTEKNSRALHIVCESVMHRNPDIVYIYLKALSKMEPLRPHYFWPLLLHRFQNNSEAGVLNVIKIMSELKVDCDFETMSYYVLPKLSVTLENVQRGIKTLEEFGLKTAHVLTPLIIQLIVQQKLEEGIKISQSYSTKLDTKLFVKPLAHLAVHVRASKSYEKYTNLIHMLHLKSNDPKVDFVGQVLLQITNHKTLGHDGIMLKCLIQNFKRLGSKMSLTAADAVSAHIVNIKSKNVDVPNIRKILETLVDKKLNLKLAGNIISNIVHPRDMSYEELECHLLELTAKNMNSRGVLRRLLQVCVRDNKLERALEVKKKCEVEKVELSPGMMASIFDMYIKMGDYTAANLTLQQLQNTFPGFPLDEHKLLDFATLTVRQNELEKAKQILITRAASSKVVGGDYVIKNVWNLLTSVAQLAAKQTDLPQGKNLTKEMFLLIRKLGFCNAQNAVLGPIIREFILRKDLRSAVSEFKTLSETFRHTPLQFELSSLLVRLSNNDDVENYNITKEEAKELLQELTYTMSSIHGEINTNSSLLLAIAESGTESQLRKLLINPEFRLNHTMLTKNCEHLNKEGSIQTLLKLAKACRGLNHVIKEHDVYNILLMKFINENNCAASLEIFEKLESDNELKMSQEFLKNLVNLLKVNKLEIPTSLALRAQIL